MLSNIPLISLIAVELDGLSEVPSTDLEINHHVEATIDWIQRAHENSADGGISKGYDLLRGRWAPAYPETTGYTIPTILNVAAREDRSGLHRLALFLANYLLNHVTPEGGVIHWEAKTHPVPIVFDTGQVIFGWLAAYRHTLDERYLTAAVRAGDWLVSLQDRTGAWLTNQHLNVEKVIDTRVAWALLELFQVTSDDKYLQTCIKNLRWAQKQQEPDGWFRNCSFWRHRDPFTHNLAYTAEGLIECGLILEDKAFINSAKLMVDAMLAQQRPDGSLASIYGAGWQVIDRSSCLTGNCQAGLLWLRFYGFEKDQKYLKAAKRAITFVAQTQKLHTSNPNIHGGIAGSYPIHGSYERFKYPNWAAKFFLDALLALEESSQGEYSPEFVG
jgi:uncharacterized protein YyaL (SSP411 family)